MSFVEHFHKFKFFIIKMIRKENDPHKYIQIYHSAISMIVAIDVEIIVVKNN